MRWYETNSFVSKESGHLKGLREATLGGRLQDGWASPDPSALRGVLGPGLGRLLS